VYLCLFLAVVLGAGGTASPGAGAVPGPVADLATADPGQGPTPVPGLGPVPAPKPAHHAEASPNLLPGPAQDLNPSLAPGLLLRDQTKDPNQDPDQEVDPSRQRTLEPPLNREM